MKIVFFGTWEFSASILRDISDYQDIDIALVVSQPDKPVWRSQEIVPTAVKSMALQKGLSIVQPERLKHNHEFLETLKAIAPDFLVVVAYGKILPQEVLDVPKYYPLNIHGSLLPKYRGASPIQESLKNGDMQTWLTIMQMTLWMDEGASFTQAILDVDIVDKTPDIFRKFALIWPNLLYETMKDIVQKGLVPTPQDETNATYCSKIEKEDGRVFFQKQTAKQIYHLLQAYTPWPWIFCTYEWKKFVIEDAFFSDESWEPWKVCILQNKQIGVFCTQGVLIFKKVKLEWKKSMDINSFTNGNKPFLDYKFE